jgi:MSHA biogenesis protein MshQ
VPNDFFSVRWTGLLEAYATGDYALQTTSDDGVRVWVDGVLLIDNWTPHGPTVDTSAAISLSRGQRVSIVVEYQDYTGGATMQLRWKLSGLPTYEPIPAARLYPPGAAAGSGTGLLGQYFASVDLSGPVVLQRTEAVAFAWGTASPGPGVPADRFSARWRGQVEATSTGTYQFQTNSDDGVRVWVNGTLVINNWTPHGPTVDTSAGIPMTAGQRMGIVVEYQDYTGGATMQLRWKPPGATAFSDVPAVRLYPAAP